MTVDQNSIVGLYVIYFNRAPDPAGLAFWQTQNVTIDNIAAQFGASPEAKAIYPFLAAPTLADPKVFINEIYQNAFGRNADEAGLTFWSNVLKQDSSPESVAEFVLAVAQGAQGTDKVALQNRADIALQFTQKAVNASIPFTPSLLATSSDIIDKVTFTAESVTAAQAATDQAIKDIIAGGTGTTFTLLDIGAVLTAAANSKVAPEGKFLSTANDKVSALTFLQGSFIQDPSNSDNDVLTAQILGPVTPNIANIETIEFTGSNAAVPDIVNISGVKNFVIKSGNLQVNTAEKFPLTLAAGYASTLTVNASAAGKDLTVNLAGTASGTKIVDANPAVLNTITGKLTLNVNADSTISELTYDDDNVAPITSNVVITGSKNLTINGILALSNGALLDGTDFKGKLSLTTNNNAANNPNIAIVGGQSDDTFNFTTFGAGTLTNATTLTGNGGVDTVTVKGTAANAFDNVTDIDKIVIAAGANSAITANASLISSVGILEVDASALAAANLLTFSVAAGATGGSLKITGGAGNDVLTGGAGNDNFTGGAGADNLTGGAGNNTLIGGAGDDILVGGDGDDLLQGDAGLNNLTGGLGKDQFVLNQSTAGNLATITDFTVADDKLALSNAAFAGAPAVGATMVISTATGPANLATTLVIDNGAALAGVDRSNIRFGIANAAGGGLLANTLYYDADGNFGTGAIAIANIGTSALTSTNFSIIA